ncbi:MAG: glycosyl hydrolase family 28-related protein [Armatimonadota bacterium]
MKARQTMAALAVGVLLSAAVEAGVGARTFGAKGNGKVDDSKAIQKVLDAAAARGGGRVDLGVGRFRLDKPITVPEGVTLAGVWEAPHHAMLQKGTVIEVYAGKGKEDGPAAVTLSPSSAVKGITFFYPEQRLPDVVPYPYTISGSGMHCSVIDCTFVNPYKAIDFGTQWNELHYIRNCYGCPLKVGIHIDRCTDIGRIENVHFNPHYWMRAECENKPADWTVLGKFLFENLVAFEFARTDWEYVHNTFCYGAKVGYRFYAGSDGTVNGNFLGIGADWCDVALLVENAQLPRLLITNGEFVAGKGGKAFMSVAPTNEGVVQLSNCSFWGPCSAVAVIEGKETVSLDQCTFHNHRAEEDPFTIDARSGDLTISGCRFGSDRPDIRLGKDVRTAIIMGNRFTRSKEIENLSAGDVQEGLNVVVK